MKPAKLDSHNDIAGNHSQFAGETIKPIAALLRDLSQRGLLDEPCRLGRGVRSPAGGAEIKKLRSRSQSARAHLLDAGGVKGGVSYGDRRDRPKPPSTNATSTTPATILHLLGMDHEKLTIATTAATSA